jgi:hypothetical protein
MFSAKLGRDLHAGMNGITFASPASQRGILLPPQLTAQQGNSRIIPMFLGHLETELYIEKRGRRTKRQISSLAETEVCTYYVCTLYNEAKDSEMGCFPTV